MLDKGIIERIVLDYKDIYKQALEDNLQSPAELPYFEGDFWPNVLEENIRELEQVKYNMIQNLAPGSYCLKYYSALPPFYPTKNSKNTQQNNSKNNTPDS